LITKFDISENQRFQITKSKGPVFTIIRWLKFLNGGQLYVLELLGLAHIEFLIISNKSQRLIHTCYATTL
jgi:hypothetical protein